MTGADVDLDARQALVRITKAWKRDGKNGCYVGASKTGSGKRTVSLPEQLAELPAPVMAGRTGSNPLFRDGGGWRITPGTLVACWTPAEKAATQTELTKAPRIHGRRHTHASWLLLDGVSLFTVSRRLGRTSTRTTEQV